MGMKLWRVYVKQRWRGLTVFLISCLIFGISFRLYHLPWEAVWYPAVVCGTVGMIGMFYDFRRVRKKYEELERIRTLTDVLVADFPSPEGMEEEEYQKILRLLGQEYTQHCIETEKKYDSMVDYYTVWAHQIKTPIASMKLQLQNEDSDFSRTLAADLFHIEQYVEMVLTFLRLDTEQTDYLFRSCDMDELVRSSVRKFAGEFIGRKIKLVYEPLHWSAVTDEKWLSFVIDQVLSNALKYTAAGTITISGKEGKKICIRDTGMGIAPEDLPRIFENGFTGYNGRSDKKASGIGLYLCKRICDHLGHTISVESQPDHGTAITLDLSRRKIEIE